MVTVSGLNTALAEEAFRRGDDQIENFPTWIGIETSAACNLRCVQCPREDPGSEFVETRMNKDIIESILPYAKYATHLQLHGLGEPLLDPSFWTIAGDERVRGVEYVDTNTNGTLLSETNVDRLLGTHINVVSISLDAATAATYRKIRGGNFDKVIAGIRRLVQRRHELGRKDLTIIVNMTLMMENISELPAFIELASDLGVDRADAWPMNQRGSGQHTWRITHDGWTFDYEEQLLSNASALSNAMVREAEVLAKEKGVNFLVRTDVWLPE